MRRVERMLLVAAIGLGFTGPSWAQVRGGMGHACAGSPASGSSAMPSGSSAGVAAFNGNPAMMTGGSNLGNGSGPSPLMAGGFSPDLNFAAASGMFGGFNNGYGMGAMSGLGAGSMIWNDGFSMGVMYAQNNPLASRNNRNAAGTDSAEPDAAAMTAAQARKAPKAAAQRMRIPPKRSKARARPVRSLSQSR